MAESQITCMDDGHINEKIKESNPEFYYSEEQRAALEQLLKNGDGAFKDRLKEDNVKDFLSAREIKSIRSTFREYCTDSEDDVDSAPVQIAKGDSGIHSTYWPQLSDFEVPPLDIGWPDGGSYKGVTRVTVHTNPPKEDGPRIKQVVRKLIQESKKVVAVVMDLLTDLQILQDLLDAACKRNVSIYILLEASGMPHFLDMCTRLQINAMHLGNIRVRTVRGMGLPLSIGKLPGFLSNKYMLVDGNKVMFGSYSFTWSASRMDRNTVLIMTGHVVDFFDRDFRELYAVSENVDLYGELHVVRAPKPVIVLPKAEPRAPPYASRFQASLGDLRDVGAAVPAHKFYNPKYSLVVGGGAGTTSSLREVLPRREPPNGPDPWGTMDKFLKANSDRPDRLVSPPVSPTDAGGAPRPNGLAPTGARLTLPGLQKVKIGNLRDSNDSSVGSTPTRASLRSPKFSLKRVTVETSLDENVRDKFVQEASEGSPLIKGRIKSFSKGSKNTSLQSVNIQDGDALKAQTRLQKKECILS
ncbi:protein FAM83F-like [Anguilla rostrata]|uniref:protein FAM83F-like n=1 Tax=Anguilla rostrata TaxID=7938 RepID=UPI0030CF8A78